MSEDAIALRHAAQRARADEWALTLAAVGVAAHVEADPPHGFAVWVAAADRARAAATLAAYDRDTAPAPPRPPLPDVGDSLAMLVVAALLAVLFAVTGPRQSGHAWFAAGSANAFRLADGEWWRLVTALFLHADIAHVMSNVVVLAIFGTALCRLVGPGAGCALVLAAGAGGNALNFLWRGPPHDVIGASTAVFGGLGALAAVRAAHLRRGAIASAWRAFAPLAAGLALLGMLGASTRSDVLAHLFGFLVGIALGGALAWAHPAPLARPWQWALLAASAAVAGGCAWRAWA